MKEITVYLDKTDFDHHIPDAMRGIRIYFSQKDIELDKKCTKNCGIVKCKLVFEEIVTKRKLG